MKTCKKCGGTEYYFPGGCATCMKATSAKRRADFHEETLSATRKWKAENRNKVREYNIAYRAAHKAETVIYTAEYRAKNKEAVLACTEQWKKANPDYWRSHVQNRRARKLQNGGKLSKGLAEKLFKLQRGKCPCCGKALGKDFHLDHKVPLAKGGANEDWNMQLLRNKCNRQKHAKDPIDFMRSRGFLL